MIDQIIKNYRALINANLDNSLYDYHHDLLKYAKDIYPSIDIPIIKIVYSLNRECETFSYGGNKYLIYDRYLGQTFNKLNRIIFFESEKETRVYLCKLLGENFFLMNNNETAFVYLVFYKTNRSTNVFNLPFDFIVKKNQLILVQESYVFFHELVHSNLNKIPNAILKTKEFLQKNDNAKIYMLLIQSSFNLNYNSPILLHFIEELTCDFISIDLTYTYYKDNILIKNNNIIEGIVLATLYLRTLNDIKEKASPNIKDTNHLYELMTKLRHNLIRAYFHSKDIFLDDKSPDLVDIYEKWDEKINIEVANFLNDDLTSKLMSIFLNNKNLYKIELLKYMLGVS